MLRDDGPLMPIAGCTDLYVNLNFGTLREKRFLNLWPLDALRGISLRGHTLSIGALTTYTELQHSPLVRRPEARRRGARGGRRPDPEPRNARR